MASGAAVLELWELLGRFAGLLQLGECPGIEALSSAVADQAADRRDCFDTAMVRARTTSRANLFPKNGPFAKHSGCSALHKLIKRVVTMV